MGVDKMSDPIVVKWFLNGVFRGTRRVSRNSLVGFLFTGEVAGVVPHIEQLKQDLEELGCSVSVKIRKSEVSDDAN